LCICKKIYKRYFPEKREGLRKQYPDLDIEEEYKTAKDWLLSKDKRFKNYPAFFRNWLRKAQKI